jgi:N-acetyl-gamma-glutamyl-phosphate reductase
MPEIDQELAGLGAEVTTVFTPHLVPLDQGEMVSCYVTLRDGNGGVGDLRELYDEAYADEPFVELADRPPGVRDVRDSNVARIFVHGDERTGKAFCFCVIDNLWKGAASQAIQNLNLMFGLDEGAGLR